MESDNQEVTFNHLLSLIGFRIRFSEAEVILKGLSLLEKADLEEVLVRAAYLAKQDFRILSILMTWVTVHANYVLVEKLEKRRDLFEGVQGLNRVFDLLAVQARIAGSHKWGKLIRVDSKHPEVPLDPEVLEASIQYQGVDEDLRKYGLLVPKKLIRIRPADVLNPGELAQINHQYRNRLLYGASWRADIITAIELGGKNPNQISRLLGCSYEPAYRVFKDYRTVHFPKAG